MKGGVGKTTIAVNTAFALSLSRLMPRRTLLIDIDPQFNATQYALGPRRTMQYINDENHPSIVDIFEKPSIGHGDQIIMRVGENIDLVPSRLELNHVLNNPTEKAHRLGNFIKSHCAEYDYIIIDCPPTDSILTKAAYRASDYLLIPTRPEYLSTIGLPLLLQSYKDFSEEHRESRLKIAGIVVNSTNNKYSKEHRMGLRDIQKFATDRKIYMFQNSIPHTTSFPNSARKGQSILLPGCYAKPDIKHRFQDFVEEFLERINNE
jgi:chromosome partitioning protein